MTQNNTQASGAEQAEQSLDPSLLLQHELDQMTKFYDILIGFFANYSFQLIGAMIIFIIGFMLSGKISAWVLRLCLSHKLDVTLSRFLANTSKMLIMVMIAIIALGKLGISVTPFIAAIGAISLGAGLAMQGLLSNYAAGFNIILIRPFVVGDTIKVQGVTGVVEEVLLAYTMLKDEDDVSIMIPNKHIVGEVLHNSKHDSLLELSVGIAYEHNPIEVVKLLEQALKDLPGISTHRRAQLGIEAFGDSAINIGIRLWTPTVELYATKYKAYETIYLALEQAQIKIPYPQRDVHFIQPSAQVKEQVKP